MCGLFAIIPTVDVDEVLAVKLRFLFQILGKKNDHRGGHSWGIWSHDFEPMRGLGDISVAGLGHMIKFLNAWKPIKHGWIAGHTRFGTHGGHTVANAHPFVVGQLTLAHNGIVDVDIPDHDVISHPVDSGQLTIAISKYGLTEALSKTSGCMGLLFSMKDNKLRAYRSSQMLNYAVCDWGYVISSDAYHLKDALEFLGMTGEVHSFEQEMVASPWYPEFTSYPVATGAYQYRGFNSFTTNKRDKKKRWKNNKHTDRPTMDEDGVWSFPTERGAKTKITRVPAGTISNHIPKGYELTVGRYNAPRVVPHPVYDRDVYYKIGGTCQCCTNTLDEEGGFFLDLGVSNEYIACCSRCLDDKAAAGLLS